MEKFIEKIKKWPLVKKMSILFGFSFLIMVLILKVNDYQHEKKRVFVKKINIQLVGIIEGKNDSPSGHDRCTIGIKIITKNIEPGDYRKVKIDNKEIDLLFGFIRNNYAVMYCDFSSQIKVKDCLVVNRDIGKIYRNRKLIKKFDIYKY